MKSTNLQSQIVIYHFKNPVRENVCFCENGQSSKCVETLTVRSWVLHKTNDGQTKIDVRFDENTVWLTMEQIAKLFNKAKSTSLFIYGAISDHFVLLWESNLYNFDLK